MNPIKVKLLSKITTPHSYRPVLFFFSLLILAFIFTGCSYRNKKTAVDSPKQNDSVETSISINPDQEDVTGKTGKLYEANIVSSKVIWQGEKVTGSQHTGEVRISNGQILLDDNDNLLSADFTIDMDSITDSQNNQSLAKHLKSADFFDVASYPISKLDIIRAEKKETNSFNITGELTVKGITQEIIFPASIKLQNNQLEANAEFNVDRTRWDIKYGSGKFFQELADKAIKDEINFKILISFRVNSPPLVADVFGDTIDA